MYRALLNIGDTTRDVRSKCANLATRESTMGNWQALIYRQLNKHRFSDWYIICSKLSFSIFGVCYFNVLSLESVTLLLVYISLARSWYNECLFVLWEWIPKLKTLFIQSNKTMYFLFITTTITMWYARRYKSVLTYT